MATRNSKLLDSLTEFCQAHPQQRFWQAVTNWSGWSYLFLGRNAVDEDTGVIYVDLEDTFYWEETKPSDNPKQFRADDAVVLLQKMHYVSEKWGRFTLQYSGESWSLANIVTWKSYHGATMLDVIDQAIADIDGVWPDDYINTHPPTEQE